jgi:hypothetical protein
MDVRPDRPLCGHIPESAPGPLFCAPRPDASDWAKVKDKIPLLEN